MMCRHHQHHCHLRLRTMMLMRLMVLISTQTNADKDMRLMTTLMVEHLLVQVATPLMSCSVFCSISMCCMNWHDIQERGLQQQ